MVQEGVPFPTKRSQGRWGTLFPPVHLPLSPRHPPGMLRGSRRGFLRSAPTSCLCRQLGLAGAVPNMHPPHWKGVNRSGCRQGSRERAGLGLHPTTTWGVGCAKARGRDGRGRPGGGVTAGSRVPAESHAHPWFNKGLGMLPCLSLPLVLRWACSLGVWRC